MSLMKHVGWSAAAAIVLTGSRFALAAVLARRLDESAYGQFTYAYWLVEFGFLLLTFGATGAVSRYAAELRSSSENLRYFLSTWRRYAYTLPFGAAGAVVVGASISGVSLSTAAVLSLAGWALMNGMWAMQTAALTGMQRFDLVFRANVLAACIMLVGAILLPVVDDVWVVFLLMMSASAAAFVVGFVEVSQRTKGARARLSESKTSEVRRYAVNIWFTALLWNIAWSRGEFPVVRAYLGDEGVAGYSVAMTLVGGGVAGVMLGIGALAPQVTKLLGQGERENALKLCRSVTDVHLLVCAAAGLFLIWLSPQLLLIAFGARYVPSHVCLSILGVVLPMMGVSLFNHYLQIRTDSRFNRNATMAGVVVLYVVAIALVQSVGAEGAAIARVFALMVMTGATILASFRLEATGGLGAKNVVLAVLICIGSLAISVSMPEDAVVGRGLGFITSLVTALIAIRRHNGDMIVLAIVRRSW